MSVYLDYAATTPPSQAALEAFMRISREHWHNPASLHEAGRAAAAELESARARIAAALNTASENIVFLSGGTEANNLALKSAAAVYGRRKKHIVSTALEHPSVLETLKALRECGFDITLVPPGRDGALRAEDVLAACREDTFLVSVCAVCAETGAASPLDELGITLRERYPETLFHTDAVQGFLRITLPSGTARPDLISISGHKIGTPKGVGALVLRTGLRMTPELHGGGQENGLRSGTSNVPLAAAFAAAVEHFIPVPPALRSEAAQLLTEAGAEVLTAGGASAPHILCFAWRSRTMGQYLPAEVLTRMLSDRGVYISAGSACKKGKRGPALDGMTLPRGMADGVVRVSFSHTTTVDDLRILCDALAAL